MKIVKRIGLALSVFVALILAVGLCMPRRFSVSRSIAIEAPPETIYPVVARLKEWPTWTAWTHDRYPDMKVEFSGPDEGIGAKQTWDGKSSGKGAIEIKSADPQQGIAYDFAFDGSPSTGGISFLPGTDDITLVTWHAEGDLGMNPIGRYFGLFMDKFMGPDFETGLANLKKKVEAANNQTILPQLTN